MTIWTDLVYQLAWAVKLSDGLDLGCIWGKAQQSTGLLRGTRYSMPEVSTGSLSLSQSDSTTVRTLKDFEFCSLFYYSLVKPRSWT